MTVDFNELKQKMDSITLELKAKAPKEFSLLVDSLVFMIKVMLELTSSDLMQSESQTEQIKTPSSDGYKKSPKKRSLRVSTGAKAGGQKGHKGAHLSVPHAPDEVKCHIPKKCQCCPNLKTCVASGDAFTCAESRYVIEAETITHVVEHQSMVATNCPFGCPGKDEKLAGEFPAAVRGYVQYVISVTVLAALLSTYGEYMFC